MQLNAKVELRACLNFTLCAANCHYRNLAKRLFLNIIPLCLGKVSLPEPCTDNFRMQKQSLNKLLSGGFFRLLEYEKLVLMAAHLWQIGQPVFICVAVAQGQQGNTLQPLFF